MAKKVSVTAQQIAPVSTAEVLSKFNGTLRKNTDENISSDWIGTISVKEKGEFFLRGFAKKDDKGVYLAINAELKKTQSDAVDDFNADRGSFFKNNRKKIKSQPDYTGFFNFTEPGEYVLHGDIMESAQKQPYMALSIAGNGTLSDVPESDLPF